MTILTLSTMGFIIYVVRAFFVLCAVMLVLIILVQKGKGGGLSGVFGGGAGAGGVLGSKTGDFLTWLTISLVAVFLMLAVIEAKFDKPHVSSFDVQPPAVQQQPAQPRETLPPVIPSSPAGDTNLPGN